MPGLPPPAAYEQSCASRGTYPRIVLVKPGTCAYLAVRFLLSFQAECFLTRCCGGTSNSCYYKPSGIGRSHGSWSVPRRPVPRSRPPPQPTNSYKLRTVFSCNPFFLFLPLFSQSFHLTPSTEEGGQSAGCGKRRRERSEFH